jgi:hypothetical protein
VDLIRPFQRDDIPRVSDLFRTAFLRNGNHDADTLHAYFERVFFENPWYDDELPSYVHVDNDGAIDAFVGVQPKRFRWRGRNLRVATPTKLMASATAAPLTASRLVRRVFAGPQDLLVSDIGNNAGRRIWEALGGTTVLLYSLQWKRPVRPAGHALSWLRARGVPGLITRGLQPLGSLADTLLARWSPTRSGRDDYSVEDLPLDVLAKGLPDLLPKRALQPQYDEPWLRWFFEIAQQREPRRVLRRRLVRDTKRQAAGWFLYFIEPGGVAEVLQVVARKDTPAMVLDALLEDARKKGATMVSGGVEPGMLDEMSSRHCYLRQAENWTLVHSRDREILDTVLSGDAFLSRLEGEW